MAFSKIDDGQFGHVEIKKKFWVWYIQFNWQNSSWLVEYALLQALANYFKENLRMFIKEIKVCCWWFMNVNN